jgi:hypothetical protein
MTAKEKAKELISMFFQYTQRRPEATLCAMVCVEEIIEEIGNYTNDGDIKHISEFYNDVLNELHKL